MTTHPAIWIGFGVFVLAMLALDLGVFHRKSHVVGFKEALGWTGAWVALALGFDLGLWAYAGREKALEFFTGYLIEYSLSADNVFVFALIFSYFRVPAPWQHKVLFWAPSVNRGVARRQRPGARRRGFSGRVFHIPRDRDLFRVACVWRGARH